MNSKAIPAALQKKWTAVDNYIESQLVPPEPVLEAARKASRTAGLPDIAVTPSQGKLLYLLARSQTARNILEIGTLAAYSTIWLGKALPSDGRLITLEFNPKHAEVARANIARAGLSDRVELREGPALKTLPKIAKEIHASFDFIFIDADKENNAAYFEWALKLGRLGSLIFVDNVIRDGEVANARSKDPMVEGVRRLNDRLAREKRVIVTTIQTVGTKGYDGFTLALVVG